MVGVCMTVVSIIRLLHLQHFATVVDRLLALDSVVFLISALLSYLSLRRSERGERAELEAYADGAFMTGLALMSICSILLAFSLL
ncbi:hypothetical protein GALL_271450 [mine drainage metagenome]|uniref:Uncharacterized protein n=1 Tax=mine drainage metagenome TaxID=410659 RepID=A0A1J5RFR7_9ZZZZ